MGFFEFCFFSLSLCFSLPFSPSKECQTCTETKRGKVSYKSTGCPNKWQEEFAAKCQVFFSSCNKASSERFWFEPEQTISSPNSLSSFCIKPIFAWIPHMQLPTRLFNSIRCLKPQCNRAGGLKTNSWANLRRVQDVEGSVYLMAMRYICIHCKTTITSSSADLVAQLPEYVLHRFPFTVKKRTVYTRRFIETFMLLAKIRP